MVPSGFCCRHGTQAFEYVQAVLLGQHDIQQHKLGQLLLHRPPEFRRQREALGLKALAFQTVDDELSDAVVVLKKINHVKSSRRFVL